MSSGYRRNLLEFEQDIGTADGSGFHVPNWQPFSPALKVWGRFVPNRGDSYWAAQQIQSDIIGLVETPYIVALAALLNADLTKLRIKMDDRYLKVESFYDPDERKKRLHLMVREELLT